MEVQTSALQLQHQSWKAVRARLNAGAAKTVKPQPKTGPHKFVAIGYSAQIPRDKFKFIFLSPEIAPKVFKNFAVRQIQDAACLVFGISRVDMLSPCRAPAFVLARQVAMGLCKRLTTRSYPEIGRHFGDRDHTTVLHSVRRVKSILDAVAERLTDIATPTEWCREIKIEAETTPLDGYDRAAASIASKRYAR